MTTKSSRREFLKKTALAGAGTLAGVGIVNVASPALLPEKIEFDPNHSHWARSQSAANPGLQKDMEVDTVVVGGGFTGLAAAYYIRQAQPTKNVAVLEARYCGSGASGRNGAMVLTMTADRFMQMSADPAMDRRIYDLTAENIRKLLALSAETGIDCELEVNGALQVFNSQENMEAGRTYVAKARSVGMPVELWSREKVSDAIGTGVYEGAFFDPNCGHVHPMKLVQVWKQAALSAGVEIYENTAVATIEEGDTVRVHTSEGRTVRARSLVLAANAYSSRLGYFRNRIAPIFNYVGITPPLTDAQLASTGWRKRLPFSDSRTIVTYLGMTRDQRVHIGGGTAHYSFNDGIGERPDAAQAYEKLRAELARVFPSLAGVGFETTWSGLVDCSLDFSSSVGRLRNNIYYGIGYCGHGVNLTSLFGRIIADFENGQEGKWKDLPFVNHALPYIPNEPFRWIGAQAAMAAYRVSG
jgi:glycine/D-amino acid oxidase-like deaminating enzyme